MVRSIRFEKESGESTFLGIYMVLSFKNSAIILPNGRKVGEPIEMHEYWVGKIRDVRARENADVWTYVQWYWSPQEIRTRVKSLSVRFLLFFFSNAI